MQLAAAGSRRNIVHFHCIFGAKMLIVHWNRNYHIQNFHLGRYIRSESRFKAPPTRGRKTEFPTVYPTIYVSKLKFSIQLSPNSNAIGNTTRRLIG